MKHIRPNLRRVTLVLALLAVAGPLAGCKPVTGNQVAGGFFSAPGDVFLGSWTNRDTTHFTVTKAGNRYLVQSVNTTGMLNGTFPSDYANGTLQTHSFFGDLTYVKASDSVYWVGHQFVRQQ